MFYGMTQEQAQRFDGALRTIKEIYPRLFAADMLIALAKNMGFLQDPAFARAMGAEPRNEQEKSLVWRLHVLCWCAENALRLPGDFVECGVYKGFSTSVVARYLDFGKRDKHWYLYDTFNGIPPDDLNAGQPDVESYRDPGLYESVVQRFASYPNISVIRGRVPEVLIKDAPERIAFIHLDMNSARAEIGALETLYARIVPGGFLVFDDYGWFAYRDQKAAEDRFFADKGMKVLELPTGQGLVIRPPG